MLQSEMLARQVCAGHWINSVPERAGLNPVPATFFKPEVGRAGKESGSGGGSKEHTLVIRPVFTANP